MKLIQLFGLVASLILLYSCTSDDQLGNEAYSILTQEEYRAAKFNRFPEQNDTLRINERTYVISDPYYNSGQLRLKGAMHNHTENSAAVDGYLSGGTPEWTCKKYRDEGGYDFISITDHNFVTDEPNVDGIVWMGPSFEDTNTSPEGHHLIIYNLPSGYQYHHISNDINEQIEYYHSIGALVSFAHPDWISQYQSDEKIMAIRQLDFVEVLNCGSGSIRAYNSMLLKGPILALSTDDFHYNPERFEANRYFDNGFIIVYGHQKERHAIWDDILRGHFYASSGARMEINYSAGIIEATSDIPSQIEFHGVDPKNPVGELILSSAKSTTSHKYVIDGTQSVVWVRLINSEGEAISQAFHVKKLE